MKLKAGVRILGVRPETVIGMHICDGVFLDRVKDDITITSVTDGQHSRGSLHYTGCAFDVRIWGIDQPMLDALKPAMQKALGDDFDVVLEKDHFHIEFQPKESY